jgi:broad specificity phosphatase PhoE
MAWIVARHAAQDTIAVVAHAGTLGAYLCGLVGMDYGSRRMPWTFDNASLTIVELGEVQVQVVSLNDTSHLNHLRKEDEP